MNDDALAAVAAAAHVLLARSAADSQVGVQTRWAIAGRMRVDDATRARIVARFPSRWTISRRLRD